MISSGRLLRAWQVAVASGTAAAQTQLVSQPPVVSASRWVSLARAGYGAALLCVPGRLIATVSGHPASRPARVTARVLGARHVAQAAICGPVPVRGLIEAGAAADGLHAASMLVLAGTDRGQRVALLADALVAAAFAAVTVAALRG